MDEREKGAAASPRVVSGTVPGVASGMANPQVTACFLGAFFDELAIWGVREVVVSPGSRSTPLAMCSYEFSRREPERLRVFVDVDERGAAFFALGLAKASGRPAALVCTSGTAVANYYPAVMEAESSRVPLIVLTGDRPPRLQGLGAPQTCDQQNAYGNHVRAFRQMPLPADDAANIAFARQVAREAVLAADPLGGAAAADAADAQPRLAGACLGGPVHLNFPFEEPLKPDFSGCGPDGDPFACGRRESGAAALRGREACAAAASAGAADAACTMLATAASASAAASKGPVAGAGSSDAGAEPGAPAEGAAATSSVAPAASAAPAPTLVGVMRTSSTLGARQASQLADLLSGGRTLVLAGEGSCATLEEAREVLAWAQAFDLPLLSDPLSGLRSLDDACVIDNYDTVIAAGGRVPEELAPRAIVRFGRCPVSKKATQMAASCPLQVVVDPWQTRDFNANTDVFVPLSPIDFVRAMQAVGSMREGAGRSVDAEARARDGGAREWNGGAGPQRAFLQAWIEANDRARVRIEAVERSEEAVAATNDAAAIADGVAAAAGEREGIGAAAASADFAAAGAGNAAGADDATGAAGSGDATGSAGSAGAAAKGAVDSFEGAYVRRLVQLAPADSCLFVANSMSIRALDTFYLREDKPLTVLCNRGLNGIDGTLSTALGAAQRFEQTTLLVGDLALLHDLNALALQRELRVQRSRVPAAPAAPAAAADCAPAAKSGVRSAMTCGSTPCIAIVLLNNKGGGIFDMLPQQSDEDYFERLFLTPQDVDFSAAARAFDVPYRRAESVEAFDEAYRGVLGMPGISLIEVPLPLSGVKERYAPYWSLE